MSLLETLLEAEGFRRKPYNDTRGVLTFGHGLTFITKKESLVIVKARIVDDAIALLEERPWLRERPGELSEILLEMRYQMGVSGVDGFIKMWIAIRAEKYGIAANEMRDSNWIEQTPERCERLAMAMQNLRTKIPIVPLTTDAELKENRSNVKPTGIKLTITKEDKEG